MEKINVAELLKDCPKGMELDCLLFDNAILTKVANFDLNYPICIDSKCGSSIWLTKYGQYVDIESAKCVIFPKGKTTWEGFVPPYKFKDGDILFVEATYNWILIYKENENKEDLYKYVATPIHPNHTYIVYDDNPLCCKKDISKIRFATKEEKTKLFEVMKDCGYKWNADTKTLEKLVKPKFKVGDRIKTIYKEDYRYIITQVTDTHYTIKEATEGFLYTEPISEDVNWELVPNKFDVSTLKPFDKVLVKDNVTKRWIPSLFGYLQSDDAYPYVVIGGVYWRCCIPYEGNEHLLDTADDCDEFYKTWE